MVAIPINTLISLKMLRTTPNTINTTQQSPDKKKKQEKYPHPVPNCSFKDSKGEIACREYLQNRFQRPFPKTSSQIYV